MENKKDDEDQSSRERSGEEDSSAKIYCWECNQSNSLTFAVPHNNNSKLSISTSNLVAIPERAFSSQELLTQVHLKEGVNSIGDQAFHGCGLVEINIPSSVQTVGRAAFAQCVSLKRAVFCQSSLPFDLGPEVFANCHSLEDLHLVRDGCGTIPKEFCMDCFALTKVALPAFLKSIGETAFASCRSMGEVCLPATLEEIGNKAFFHCKMLHTVTFSKVPTLEQLTVEPVQLVVGESALEGCVRLQHLRLPSTIQTLGGRALARCYSLAILDLPEQLQVLGPGALDEVTRIDSIRIPKSVQSIPHRAFYGCKKLRFVEFASDGKLESIESESFACCPKLASVYVPSFVKRIGSHAFSRCHQLLSVELSDATAVDPSAFSSCHHLVNLRMTNILPFQPFQDSCTFEEDAWPSDGLIDCKRIQQVYTSDLHGGGDSNSRMDENTTNRNKEKSVDMLRKLTTRWSRLPFHRLCYDQIHRSPEETVHAMQQTQLLTRNKRNEFQPFDEFGMAPFHILAMSGNPRYQVFAQLLRLYSVDVLFTRNLWGMRPAFCAFRNLHLNYTTVVHQYIRAIASVRVPQLRRKRWRLTIYQLLEAFCPENTSRRARDLVRLQRKLALFEHLEGMALLEHAVWKKKLTEGKIPIAVERSIAGESSPGGQHKRIKTDIQRNPEADFRLACRTVSGANVVIFRVLPFLGDPFLETTV